MIVIGQSHVGGIVMAAREVGEVLEVVQLKAMDRSEILAAGELTAGFKAKLAEVIERDKSSVVFSTIGGSIHTALGLFQHPRLFDFIVPQREEFLCEPDAEIVPFGAVQETLVERTRFDARLIHALKAWLPGRLIHLNCPPPVGDTSFIHAGSWKAAAERIANEKISPAPLRYKLWLVASAVMEAHCRQAGVKFVPVPAMACDEDGYLAERYRRDAAHGNAAYGRLVLRQMRSYLQ